MTLWEILQSAEVEAGCNISHNVMCRVIIYYNYWSPWNPIAACLWIFDYSHTYTYFKKRCRREWRMAVVERKLHDRKELWFPYLQKNNEFFATTTATKTSQICIFDNGNSIFARFARAFFIFWHFEDVLVLSMTWNDLFCSCVDDVSIWWQIFNFVLSEALVPI